MKLYIYESPTHADTLEVSDSPPIGLGALVLMAVLIGIGWVAEILGPVLFAVLVWSVIAGAAFWFYRVLTWRPEQPQAQEQAPVADPYAEMPDHVEEMYATNRAKFEQMFGN